MPSLATPHVRYQPVARFIEAQPGRDLSGCPKKEWEPAAANRPSFAQIGLNRSRLSQVASEPLCRRPASRTRCGLKTIGSLAPAYWSGGLTSRGGRGPVRIQQTA